MELSPPPAPLALPLLTARSPAKQTPKKKHKKPQSSPHNKKPQGSPHNKKPKRRRGLKQPLTKDMPRALAELLNEPKVALLHRVVKHAGPKLAWQLLRETLRLEREGGQPVNAEASGKPELFFVVDEVSREYKPRRRTSGGVFFRLLKEKVPKEVYRTIYEVEERKKKDAKKKARNRQRQRMDSTLAKLGFDELTIEAEEKQATASAAEPAEAGELAEDVQM